MKTFTTAFNTEKDKKTGASPVWILKCPFPSTGTIYLSDRIFTVSSWDGGVTTKSWVASWGQIDEDISGEMSLTKVSDFSLSLIIDPDASPDIATILWTAANNIETTDCELYLWFLGLNASTDPPQKMWTGNIIDFEKLDELIYSVSMVDISVRLDKYIGTKVDNATYPNADTDDVGKTMPIIYGSCKSVPALKVDWGARTSLKTGITASATIIYLSDASMFPASGAVWIDEEKISYTGKTTYTLTGCSRGVDGTTAVPHNAGAEVWEHKTNYDSLLASHACKAVGDIFAVFNNLKHRVTTGISAVVVSGKQYLRATTQINVKPGENIGVDDGIAVSDDISYSSSGSTKTTYPNAHTGSTFTDPQDAYDGNENSYSSGGGTDNLILLFPSINYGSINIQYFWIIYACSADASYGIPDTTETTLPNTGGLKQRRRVSKTGGSWSDRIEFYCGASTLTVYEVWKEVDYIPTLSKSGEAYRTGAVSKNGGIIATKYVDYFIADVDGYKDDASGTYTGTPNALIERPDHIFKHFLAVYANWAIADFYTNAGSSFSTKGYAFSVVINEYRKLKEWLAFMAFQSRCYFRFAAGKANLLWRPDSVTSDKTITAAMIRMGEDAKTSLRGPRRSPLDEVINKITIHYDKIWAKSGDDAYTKTAEASDATSITRYGEKEKPELFKFDFVTIQAMAEDLRDFYIARYKDRRKVVEMEVFLDNAEIEFADGVTIAPLSNLLCEVQKANIQPGSGKEMRNDIINLLLKGY